MDRPISHSGSKCLCMRMESSDTAVGVTVLRFFFRFRFRFFIGVVRITMVVRLTSAGRENGGKASFVRFVFYCDTSALKVGFAFF